MTRTRYLVDNPRILSIVLGFLLALGLIACGGSSTGATPAPPNPTKGSRTLGLDVNEATGETYDQAIALAKGIGMDELKISLDWNSVETGPSTFDFTIPDIVDIYYPANNLPITLVLRPINTNSLTLPSDLAALAFDNATVIARFQAFMNALAARLTSVTIQRILIGNEIDSYLGTDAARWAAFTTFFQAVKPTAKSAFGAAIPVSTIGQFGGHTGAGTQSFFQAFASSTDFVAVNYYPLASGFRVRPTADIATDFDQLVALYPGQTIVFQECGLPSGSLCSSSEVTQSAFITAVFEAWDRHATAITHIDFTWMTDQPATKVAGWIVQYGMSGHPDESRFREYLATLGLRSESGVVKQAWTTLGSEAAARGW